MLVNLGYERVFLEKSSSYQQGLCGLYREQRFWYWSRFTESVLCLLKIVPLVYQVLLFYDKKTSKYLLVCTIHGYSVSASEGDLMRLVQFAGLLKNAFKEYENTNSVRDNITVVICGDFNSSPSSMVLELLKNGFSEILKEKLFNTHECLKKEIIYEFWKRRDYWILRSSWKIVAMMVFLMILSLLIMLINFKGF